MERYASLFHKKDRHFENDNILGQYTAKDV